VTFEHLRDEGRKRAAAYTLHRFMASAGLKRGKLQKKKTKKRKEERGRKKPLPKAINRQETCRKIVTDRAHQSHREKEKKK